MSFLPKYGSGAPNLHPIKVRWFDDLSQFFPLSVNGWKLEPDLRREFLEVFGDHPKNPSFLDISSLSADFYEEHRNVCQDCRSNPQEKVGWGHASHSGNSQEFPPLKL